MSILRYKRFALADGGVARGGDGGGGGGTPAAQPTQTTVQNTNIPEYAQPYVETMLGAAQQQIFNYDANGNATGMKPYTPYSSNPQDYVAGFSPLQQQAQSNVANMSTPQQYQDASQMAAAGSMGSFGLAGQEAQTGQNLAQASTNPYAVGAYMNPYIQNALAPSQQLLNQQYGMKGAQEQGAATQAGAFGGSRNALMQGLNEQNRMLAQNQLVGNAYQNAFGQAQNQMNTVSAQGLAGQQAAMQGLGQGIQGAGTLGTLGGQQAQTALGINSAQQASGAAQQAQQQNIINQQIQNYATAQQYPMMQLANMSGLLRGLPMQSATTQTYQAAPSAVSQLGGLGATALGAYGASGGFKSAKAGGLMESKSFAEGGAVRFSSGGSSVVNAVESDLENMDIPHLIQQAKTSPSPTVRQEAVRILTEKQAEAAVAKGVGAAPTTNEMFSAAGGGIVAFADGGSAFTDEEMYAGSNRQTPLPPVASQGPMTPGLKSSISWLDQLKALGYGQSSEEDKAIREGIKSDREELKANKDQNLWRSLMMGGAKAMASTSPYAGVGIGQGVGAGVEEYGKGTKDFNDQLNKLRSGELDLSKISAAEKNNLLHYAITGATGEREAELRADATTEAAKLRAQTLGLEKGKNLDAKILTIAKGLYDTDIKEATDKNGLTHLTEEQKDALMRKAIQRAATLQTDIAAAKGGNKGGSGAGTMRFDKDGNPIKG
jgi:hypothetical protein